MDSRGNIPEGIAGYGEKFITNSSGKFLENFSEEFGAISVVIIFQQEESS